MIPAGTAREVELKLCAAIFLSLLCSFWCSLWTFIFFYIYLILKVQYISRPILEGRYLCLRLKQQQLNLCFRGYIPIYLTQIMRDTLLLRGIDLCQLPYLWSTLTRFGDFVYVQILNTKFKCFLLGSLMHFFSLVLEKVLVFLWSLHLIFFSLSDEVLFCLFVSFFPSIILWNILFVCLWWSSILKIFLSTIILCCFNLIFCFTVSYFFTLLL